MNKTLRISLFGLAGAVAGFTLQGCFSPQPLPECSVTITSAGFGLSPYYVKLDKVDGTGTCADLDHMYAGMQRYRTKPLGGDFRLAVKASPLADPHLGYTLAANLDPTNDCANEEDCQGADDPTMACVVGASDGGVELFDGTPVDVADDVGTVNLADGGSYEVDLANECGEVQEPVYRVDPADPDGKNLNAFGKLPQFPTNGVCSIAQWEAGSGVQNFEAISETQVDGSPFTVPAEKHAIEWADFNLINSTKVPGTAFTANVKYTVGGCVANYKAVGFWPEVSCAEDVDCSPNADLDAGRVFGSGINPEFKPVCDKDRGVCVPSVDVTTLTK
jgi:hypothetical protein